MGPCLKEREVLDFQCTGRRDDIVSDIEFGTPYEPLPEPPRRNETSWEVFASKGDQFLAALPGFGTWLETVRLIGVAALQAAPAAIAAANYQGEYNPAATYLIGQSVSHGGTRWYAKTVNTGVAPVDGANWGPIRDIPSPAGHEGKALRVVGGALAWSALQPGAVNLGDAIYKPDTTITVTDANGAKWLRTGSWVPIDAEITSGLSGIAGYAESMWRPISAPSFNVVRFTVAAGEFWMCGPAGGLAYSADGITWTSVNIAVANAVQGIATNGAGLYVAVQAGSVHRSTNKGASWSAATSVGVTGVITNIAYGAGVFVVITGSTTGNSIATSPDGVTWTIRTNPVTQVLRNIAFAGGQFVAVGDAGAVITSPDGITWTSRTYGNSDNLNNIAYVAGRYVAGGSNLRSSADAVTWAATTGMSGTQNFASTGTVLFGKATSALWSSTNGTSASAVPGGSTDPLRPNNTNFAATSSAVLSVDNTGGAGVILRPDVAKQTQSFAASSVVGALNLYARYA
jgi:hypothetical protein